MPGDNPTLPEKSAQHYVFLGGRSDADPVSKRDRATCIRPFVSTKMLKQAGRPCSSLSVRLGEACTFLSCALCRQVLAHEAPGRSPPPPRDLRALAVESHLKL